MDGGASDDQAPAPNVRQPPPSSSTGLADLIPNVLMLAVLALFAANVVPNAGDIQMPNVEMPSVQMPSMQLPSVQLPSVQLPSLEMPALDTTTPSYQSSGGKKKLGQD